MRCPAARSLGATILLAIHLLGCTEWHVEQAAPQALLDARHPTRVRITLRDSTRMVLAHSSNQTASPYGQVPGRSSGGAVAEIVLANPSIIRDTLVGQIQGRFSGVAVADISSMALRRPSGVKTLALLGVIGLLVAGVVAAGSGMGGVGGGIGFGH